LLCRFFEEAFQDAGAAGGPRRVPHG